MFNNRKIAAAFAAALAIAPPATAAPAMKWVSTWHASPQAAWGSDFILPTNVPASVELQTVREIARVSVGGRRVRLVFSNRYGSTPVEIGAVQLAIAGRGSAVQAGSGRAVTFGGLASATIQAGAPLVSDPVELELAPLARLAVSAYFPVRTALATFHWGAQQTGYIADGNVAAAEEILPSRLVQGRLFLSGVLVEAAAEARTVVTLGDSITDGNGSTPDADRRWPDFLAQRFAHRHVAVANAGISGARLLGDRMGASALARFEQDVLGQPGIASVVVLMGINDIGWPGSPFAPGEREMDAARLIAGYSQLVAAARTRNVRIVGATLPPFEGALRGTPFEGHYSARKERLRGEINRWIRSAGAFDAVIDFDALLRDPAHPSRLLPAYDSGDHLHPGDAGYRAMAGAIGLDTLFGKVAAARK